MAKTFTLSAEEQKKLKPLGGGTSNRKTFTLSAEEQKKLKPLTSKDTGSNDQRYTITYGGESIEGLTAAGLNYVKKMDAGTNPKSYVGVDDAEKNALAKYMKMRDKSQKSYVSDSGRIVYKRSPIDSLNIKIANAEKKKNEIPDKLKRVNDEKYNYMIKLEADAKNSKEIDKKSALEKINTYDKQMEEYRKENNRLDAEIAGYKMERDMVMVSEKYGIEPQNFDMKKMADWGLEHGFVITMEGDSINPYKKNVSENQKKEADILLHLARTNETRKNAENHPVATSVGTVVTAPIRSGIGALAVVDDAFHTATGKEINPYSDLHSVGNATNTIRQTVGDKYATKWFGGKETAVTGNIGKFTYDTLMSMGDNVTNLLTAKAIAGGFGLSAAKTADLTSKITSGLMSSGAAADSIANAKLKGYTDEQALTIGISTGITEYLTEKIPLDNILKTPKSLVKGMLVGFVSEGLEEGASNWANKLTDYLIAGEDSDISMAIEGYISEGKSNKDAILKAIGDSLLDDTRAILSGGFSGMGMSAAYQAPNRVKTNIAGRRIATGKYRDVTLSAVLSKGLSSQDAEIRKKAEVVADMEQGDTKKGQYHYKIGELAMDILSEDKYAFTSATKMENARKLTEAVAGKVSLSKDAEAEILETFAMSDMASGDAILPRDNIAGRIKYRTDVIAKGYKDATGRELNYGKIFNANLRSFGDRKGFVLTADTLMDYADAVAESLAPGSQVYKELSANTDNIAQYICDLGGRESYDGLSPAVAMVVRQYNNAISNLTTYGGELHKSIYGEVAIEETTTESAEETSNIKLTNTAKQGTIKVTENAVDVSSVVNAIGNTIKDGALQPISVYMQNEVGTQDWDVFARKIIDNYRATGNIGEVSKYFADGGKAIIEAIESVDRTDVARFSLFPGGVFPKGSQASEVAIQWAHNEDVDTQRIVFYKDNAYLIEKFESMDLGYLVVEKLKKKDLERYKRRKSIDIEEDYDDKNRGLQPRREGTVSDNGQNRGIGESRGRNSDVDNGFDKHNGEAGKIQRVDREQDGGRSAEGKGSRDISRRFENRENVADNTGGTTYESERTTQGRTLRDTADVERTAGKRTQEHSEGISRETGDAQSTASETAVRKQIKGVTYNEVQRDNYTEDMIALEQENKSKYGVDTVYFTGHAIDGDGTEANGFYYKGTLYLQIDDVHTLRSIRDHEITHHSAKTKAYETFRKAVKAKMSVEQFKAWKEEVRLAYGDVLNAYLVNKFKQSGGSLTDAQLQTLMDDYLEEEMMANLNAESVGFASEYAQEIADFRKGIDNSSNISNAEVSTEGKAENKPGEYSKEIDTGEVRWQAIKHDNKGGKYWEIETGKDIFRNIKNRKELRKTAYDFILKGDKGEIINEIIDGEPLSFTRISADEYVYGRAGKTLDATDYDKKMRMAPSITDLIENASVEYDTPDHKNHKFAKDGFKNYRGRVRIDDVIFEYVVRVGKNADKNMFYDINLEVESALPSTKVRQSYKSDSTSRDRIPQNDTSVKNNSMQETEKLSAENEDIRLSVSKKNEGDLNGYEQNSNGEKLGQLKNKSEAEGHHRMGSVGQIQPTESNTPHTKRIHRSGVSAETLTSSGLTVEQSILKAQNTMEGMTTEFYARATENGIEQTDVFLTENTIYYPNAEFERTDISLKNGTASFTEKRFNDLIEEFSVPVGGQLNRDYAKGYVAYISPSDFLSLTTTNEQGIINQVKTSSEYGGGSLDVKELSENTQTPYLVIDFDEGKVFEHEGRHRMVMLRDAGINKVAIVVKAINPEEGKYSTQKMTNMTVTGQKFRSGIAPGKVTLEEIIPLSPNYRDEVREKYVDVESDLRFSVSTETQDRIAKTLFTENEDIRLSVSKKNEGDLNEKEENRNPERMGDNGIGESRDSIWKRSDGTQGIYTYVGAHAETLQERSGMGYEEIDWSGVLGDIHVYEQSEKEYAYGIIRKISQTRLSGIDNQSRSLTAEQQNYFADSMAKDSSGNLLTLYHATDNSFDEFTVGDFAYHVGALPQAMDMNKEYIKEVYIDLKNPLFIAFDASYWEGSDIALEAMEQNIISTKEYDTLSSMEGFDNNDSNSPANMAIKKLLKEKGYDGIVYRNDFEARGLSFMLFDSNQIKYTSNKKPSSSSNLRFSVSTETQDRITEIAKNEVFHEELTELARKNKKEFISRVRENETLQKRLDNANRQMRLTKVPIADRGKVPKVLRDIMKEMRGTIKPGTDEYGAIYTEILSIYDEYISAVQNSGRVSEKLQEAADNMVRRFTDVAADIVDSAQEMSPAEDYKRLKDWIKSTAIVVPMDARKEADFGTFRKKHFGAFNLTNEGLPIDMAYQEMCEMFPYVFDDTVTAPADQLNAMADALEALKPEVYNPHAEYIDDAIEHVVSRFVLEADGIARTKDTRADRLVKKAEADKHTALEKQQKAFEKKYDNYKEKTDAEIAKLKEQMQGHRYTQYWERRLSAEEKSQAIRNLRDRQKKSAVKAHIRKMVSELKQGLDKTEKSGGIPKELVRAIAEVCSVIDLHTDRTGPDGEPTKASLKLDALQVQYDELKNNPDFDISSEWDEELSQFISRLNTTVRGKKVVDLSFMELTYLNDILVQIRHTIANAKKQIGIDNALENREIGIKICDDMNEREDFISSSKKMLTKRKATNTFAANTLNPMRVAEMISGYDREAEFYKLFRQLNEGVHKGDMFKMDATKPFENLMEGLGNQALMYDFLTELYDTGIKDTKGNKVLLPKNMICEIIMLWERKQGRAHLEAGGMTLPNLKLFNSGKTSEAYTEGASRTRGITEADISRLRGMLNSYDKAWIEEARILFNEKSQRAINETSMQLLGRNIANAKNYIPIHTDRKFIRTDIEGLKLDATLEGAGFLKSVVDNAKQPVLITGLSYSTSEHIDFVRKYHGLAIPIRNFNKVYNVSFNDETGTAQSVKETIGNKWGTKIQNGVIEQTLRDLQTNRNRASDTVSKVVATIQSNWIGATLSSNPSVSIKQLTSYVTAGAVLGSSPLIKALPYFANTKATIAEIDRHTGIHFKRRLGYSTQELGDRANRKTGQGLANKARKVLSQSQLTSWVNRLPKGFFPSNWMQSVDCRVAAVLWEASKYYVSDTMKLNPGDNNYWTEVTQIYERTIEETQSNYDILHKPEVLKSTNEMTRLVSMFQNDALQGSGILWNSFNNWNTKHQNYKKEQTKENETALKDAQIRFKQAVFAQMSSALTLATLTLVARALIRKVKPYKDKEKEKVTAESITKQVGYDTLGNLFTNAVPVLGNLLVSAKDTFIYGYDIASVPAFDTIQELIEAVSGFVDTHDKYFSDGSGYSSEEKTDAILSEAKNVVIAATPLLGIPLQNALNMFNGIKGYVGDAVEGDFFHDIDDIIATNRRYYSYSDLASAISSGNTKQEMKIREYYKNIGVEIQKGSLTTQLKPAYVEYFVDEPHKARELKRKLGSYYGYTVKEFDNWIYTAYINAVISDTEYADEIEHSAKAQSFFWNYSEIHKTAAALYKELYEENSEDVKKVREPLRKKLKISNSYFDTWEREVKEKQRKKDAKMEAEKAKYK